MISSVFLLPKASDALIVKIYSQILCAVSYIIKVGLTISNPSSCYNNGLAGSVGTHHARISALYRQTCIIEKIRSIVSGQVNPLDVSETNATVGGEQLSAASITTLISGTGISAVHSTVMDVGLLPVGSIVSSTTIY